MSTYSNRLQPALQKLL